MSRAFSKIWIVIILIVVTIGVGYGVLEYQKISGTIAKAKQLAEEKNYNQSIEELEFVQEKWIVKRVGIKKQEIKQLLKNRVNYENGVDKIREKDWEGARELFLSISEKSLFYPDAVNKVEVLEEILGCEYVKGEYKMNIFDSQGRVTGIVNGELKEEIPGSILIYNEEKKTHTAVIFKAQDTYIYEIYAVKEGNYQLTLLSLIEGEIIKFYLENIPILTSETHRVQADVKAIKEGREGTAFLLIDTDSDGEFEDEITFSKELTCEEFIAHTKMPEIEIESSEGGLSASQ